MEGRFDGPIISCIQSGLYIGNAAAAADAEILRREKIKNVVSVWDGQSAEKLYKDLGIGWKKFPINDCKFMNLEGKLTTEIFPWMKVGESVYEETILVHCERGISRSTSMVITYLVWGGMPFEKAFKLVTEKHPIAKPSPDVIESFLKHIGVHVPNLFEILDKDFERAHREIRNRGL